jgi:t-SNARE complex subunit (syntaxin)
MGFTAAGAYLVNSIDLQQVMDGQQSPWVVVIASAVSVLTMAAQVYTLRSLRRGAEEDPAEAIRRRVKRVNKAFVEATALMDDLQRLHAEQQQALKKTMAEVEEHQRYLEINPEQAEKVQQVLTRGARAQQFREWAFFVAGIALSAALSIPVGVYVNSIS